MMDGLSDTTLMRLGIGVLAVLVFLVIFLTSRSRQAQGRRLAAAEASSRVEPSLREAIEADDEVAVAEGTGESLAGRVASAIGSRPVPEYDKIVSIYLVARAGQAIAGPDLVVAAEKAGLVYGHMNIFHRMVDQHPELGPIFSVANLVKPGHFDLRTIKELQTPGVNFFITLPGPLSALDAWDTLLPTAQRMAELLDAVLLDEERNALGRQRIANIRDEMRAYDRAREKTTIRPGR